MKSIWLLALFGLSWGTANAADICAPILKVTRDILPNAQAYYLSCRESNDKYDAANAAFGIRSFQSKQEVYARLPKPDSAFADDTRRLALSWSPNINELVRQDSAAQRLLWKALSEAEARREDVGKLQNAISAHTKVQQKGENLKRFLLIYTEKLYKAAAVEDSLKRFYEEEPSVFRIPATIKDKLND